MATKIQFSDKQIEDMIFLYTVDNLSMQTISLRYNVSKSVIARILKDNNVNIKSNKDYLKKHCNEEYFNIIDAEEKAYWLGFIYADGCVSHRNPADMFEIRLSIEDKFHLEKFKSAIKSEHRIGTYVSHSGYNTGKEFCNFSIINQRFVDGLISNGVIYRKTSALSFPTEQQVPNHLVSHFIRGYFDGDGSVYYSVGSNSGAISFTGTQHMLDGILNKIQQVIPTKSKVHKYKDKDVYDLKIGGANYFKQCYLYLYKDATIFLDRKKEKFEEILSE